MANQNPESNDEEPAPKSGVGLVGALGLFLVAAAAGICLPIFLPNLFAAASTENAEESENETLSVHNGMTYLSFGEVTVNLDEGRMNRYLRIKMSLQVKESDKIKVEELLASRQLVLKNWLLSHLSDKTLDEIRGKAGQNQLRRELRTYFNSTLFSDGHERIYDILFEEFNVQ